MMMNDKDTAQVDDKLEDALALLAAGIPVDDILAEAGPDAGWLRPLLAVAEDIGELRTAVPIPSPEASLQRMLAYSRDAAAATSPAAPPRQNWLTLLTTFLSGGWLPRMAAGLASALLLVVLLGGMVTVLAQRSLPGQPLYGLKRIVENARLSLTLDPQDRAQLLETYNEQRQTETRLLLQQNEVARVSFAGVVEAANETDLTLAGLTLQLTAQTRINGPLAVGARVEVDAITQPPDRLTALTVTVVEPAPPTPTPLPSPTSTASPTPSPTATATATRSLSSDTDILVLPTLTPTATPTPAPTDTSTPLPPPPTNTPIPLPPPPTDTPVLSPPTSPTPAPPSGGDNTNDGGNESPDGDGNNNGNENQPDDNGGGDDNSNDDSGGDDNSGSGSDNSGGGGNDNSGGGGGDNSGSGSSNSGSGGGGGGDNDNKSKD